VHLFFSLVELQVLQGLLQSINGISPVVTSSMMKLSNVLVLSVKERDEAVCGLMKLEIWNETGDVRLFEELKPPLI
jgi:hypothetical protein